MLDHGGVAWARLPGNNGAKMNASHKLSYLEQNHILIKRLSVEAHQEGAIHLARDVQHSNHKQSIHDCNPPSFKRATRSSKV